MSGTDYTQKQCYKYYPVLLLPQYVSGEDNSGATALDLAAGNGAIREKLKDENRRSLSKT